LLIKIKQAYDEYVRKAQESQITTPVERPSYEELASQVGDLERTVSKQEM